MSNRFMISVATLALVAGTGLANAQGTMNRDSGGGAGGAQMQHSQRSEEHTSELQSPVQLVCRLLLEKKKTLAFRRAAPPILSVAHADRIATLSRQPPGDGRTC